MSTVSIECLVCATVLEFRPGVRSVMCPVCEEPRPLPLRMPEQIPSVVVGSGEPWQDTLENRATATCSSCVAMFSAARALEQCPYCRTKLTPYVAPAPVMAAHGYLPFLLDANAAGAALQGELSRLSLSAGPHRPEPLYLPWLLVTCHVRAVYEGRVGFRVERRDPQTGVHQIHVEWTQAVGAVERPWENQGGCASSAMPAELARRLLPWDFAFTEPIDAESLARIPTEHVRFEPEQVFTWAVPNFTEELRAAAYEDMRTEYRELHDVHPQRQDERFTLVLVPVWVGTTSNGLRWAVNARTGEVVVDARAGLETEELDVPLAPDRSKYVRLGLALAFVVGLCGAVAWLMMA